MRNFVAAEWTKMLPHKGTWLLVWIYPILFFVVLTIAIFAEGANPDAMSAQGWIEDTTMVWYLPSITLGRYFIAAYFALVFAGEYGWNTWKLVVPHAARWKLIAAKYAVALGLLYAAWTLTALLSIVMQTIRTVAVGAELPAGVGLGPLLDGHVHLMMMGIGGMLLTAVYATTAAVLTRSTLASVIISLVLITFDELFGRLAQWLSTMGMEWPTAIYRLLPGYHMQNIGSWMERGHALSIKMATGAVVEYSYAMSFAVMTAWILGLGAVTLGVFRRQDIN